MINEEKLLSKFKKEYKIPFDLSDEKIKQLLCYQLYLISHIKTNIIKDFFLTKVIEKLLSQKPVVVVLLYIVLFIVLACILSFGIYGMTRMILNK